MSISRYTHYPYSVETPFLQDGVRASQLLISENETNMNQITSVRTSSPQASSQGVSPTNEDSVLEVSQQRAFLSLDELVENLHQQGLISITEVAERFVESPDHLFLDFIAKNLEYDYFISYNNVPYYSVSRINGIISRLLGGATINHSDFTFAHRFANYLVFHPLTKKF